MLCVRGCQQLALPCGSLALRSMSSLHALVGAVQPDSSSSSLVPERSIPPAGDNSTGQQPGTELPSLCGEPKNKVRVA